MRNISIWNPWGVFPRSWADFEDDMEGVDTEMDMYEEGSNVVVKLKAPGFKKNQLDISIESGKVTITGKAEETTEEENKKRKYYRHEMSVKSFTRTAVLPADVIPERAEAKFEDGILTLTIPKSEESKPRRVQISPQ